MNKYLMLSAAALMATATTSVTNAKGSGNVHLVAHSPGGASYCDTYAITWSGNNYADIVDWHPCGISSSSNGMGIKGKKAKSITLSDSYAGDEEFGYHDSWQFGIPFKNGKEFNAYYTTNGTTVTEYIFGGTYQIAGAPVHPSHLSTASALPRRVRR